MSTFDTITVNREIIGNLNWDMQDDYFILYVLAIYYHNGLISEAKYKGQLKSLRDGNLQKFKGTYHCELNDRWYEHESARSVFEQVLDDINYEYITADKLIATIMLYLNKNYNFAVNIFFDQYLRPMIDRWAKGYWSSNNFSYANSLNLDLDIERVRESGYCCWECGHTSSDTVNIHRTVDIAEKEVLEWLHTQKKGNLKKIPKYDGEPGFMGKW